MRYIELINESPYEFYQDLVIGLSFLIIFIFAAVRTRLYFDPFGQGRVITTFYILILLTSLSRAIWFLIPSYQLEGSYIPDALVAFQSDKWIGCIISEVLLVTGNLLLYSQFILVVSYWAYMLRKTGSSKPVPNTRVPAITSTSTHTALSNYLYVISITILLEAINISLFIAQYYNSEVMILYDSILMSILSLATLVALVYYSSKIRSVMEKIGKLNRNAAAGAIMKAQIGRIFAITVGAVLFFIFRTSTELALAISIGRMMYEEKSLLLLMTEKYWDLYILLKHGLEVVVLVVELIVSTNISDPDADKRRRAASEVEIGSLSSSKATEKTPLINANSISMRPYVDPNLSDKATEFAIVT